MKDKQRRIRIFLVEDDEIFAQTVQIYLEKKFNFRFDIYRFTEGAVCLENLKLSPDLVLVDLNLPNLPGLELLKRLKVYNPNLKTIIVSGQEDVKTAVEVYKAGVDYYIVKGPSCWDELYGAIETLSKKVSLQIKVRSLKNGILDRDAYPRILGNSPAILNVLKLIRKVEQNNITVLISGESGTGKELVAQALHYNSSRSRKNFVPVNVPAIPDDLIETELFGHEKGAFTGAVRKHIGKFEEADGGTIFLDEIGEMNLGLQAKLLRVLQENEVSRVGNNKIIKIDLRVVASTNRDLLQEVKAGRFREDLFYRLNGFQINLPPLRDRGEDVLLLAKHFLKAFCKTNSMHELRIDKAALRSLRAYHWPGNVRELKAVIERAALLSDSSLITEDELMYSESPHSAQNLRKAQ